MKRFFTIAMLVAFTGALSAGEREVVKPLIADKLISGDGVKPEIGTGTVRVVGSSPHEGKAEILKAEKVKSVRGLLNPEP